MKHLDENWEPNRNEFAPKMKLVFGGSNDGLMDFGGKLDEIAFFNRALTSDEIKNTTPKTEYSRLETDYFKKDRKSS